VARNEARKGRARRERSHDLVAVATTSAIDSVHRMTNTFEPVSQNRTRMIAALITLTVMVTGTSRVTASICLARIRPISLSLISPGSIAAMAEKPPT
jgi:hypothetical protein